MMGEEEPMSTPLLLRRRSDFLGVDEEAHAHPNRFYFFRKSDNVDDVINTCTKKLQVEANNSQALYLRGSSLFKKREYAAAIQDLDAVIQHVPTHSECLYYR